MLKRSVKRDGYAHSLDKREKLGQQMVRDVTALQEEHKLSTTFLSRKSGVTAQTIRRWRKDPPRHAQIPTARVLLRSMGLDLMIVRRNRMED
jgi:hypothetical protein